VPLYVLALTDRSPGFDRIGERRLHDVNVGAIHAICQRRKEAPPLTDEELRRQHAGVIAISRRVRAILPVRFGALLARDDLVTRLRANEEEIHRGFDEVRDRVQMTVRVLGALPSQSPTPAATGREYLEQRLRATAPELPARARAFLDAVRPFVMRERQARGAPGLLASVYQLVESGDVAQYQRIAARMTDTDVLWSGPWPPFAFTPPLL
jgi:hypothetical protein